MRASDILPRVHDAPVRGVLLDVCGTLFSFDKLPALFAACGLDAAGAPGWLARMGSDGMALAAAQDYRRFQEVAASALAAIFPGVEDRVVQRVLDGLLELDPYPDAEDGLLRLRKAGVRILTLCLASRLACQALFVRAGLETLVDGFLSVEPVRRWKPAPEAYAYGVAQTGWPPAQVALISAHDWDVHGARRAGLRTGQIVRPGSAPAPIFENATFAGPDLPSVVELLLSCK